MRVSDGWQTLVVVGAGAAGMAAAGRVHRVAPEKRIIILDQAPLAPVGTCGLPYLISGQVEKPADLVLGHEEGLDLRCLHQVQSIDFTSQRIQGRCLDNQRSFDLPYDRLLLAPGGGSVGLGRAFDGPRRHGNLFVPRNLSEILRLQVFLEQARPRRALVIGGGYIGVEMAEALSHRGVAVTLLEQGNTLMGLEPDLTKILLDVLLAQGVETHLQQTVATLSPQSAPTLSEAWSEHNQWPFDLVVVATGVGPSSPLLADLKLSKAESGAVRVDFRGATSKPNVYAAGDCIEVEHAVSGRPTHIPLARPAVAQGLAVAESLLGGSPSRHAWRGVGTLGLRIFGLEMATTGLNSSQARALGLVAASAAIETPSRASYYRGGAPLRVRLLAEKRSGRLLGAQALGNEGAIMAVNLFSQAILQGSTVDRLAELETAYHPSLASIWEPLHLLSRRWPKEVAIGH